MNETIYTVIKLSSRYNNKIAKLFRKVYNVEDTILNQIMWHTTKSTPNYKAKYCSDNINIL